MNQDGNDLISIVIPTYKRNETLKRALDSAISQTYSPIEIIVVDDNADYPDVRSNNESIIKEYSNCNIKLVKNDKNLGGGLSRNAGIQVASGKYICFLDDDDEYLPDKVEKQFKRYIEANNDNVAMVYCYAKMIRVDGTTYFHQKDLEGVLLLENVINCIAATSWWFCPKDKLISVGGFEDISSRQDASLLMKFFLKGYEVIRIPEVLLNYYWHDANNGISKISKKTLEAEKQYRDLFLKNSSTIPANIRKKIEYQFSYRLALQYILLKDRKHARLMLKKMIQLNFFDKRNIRVVIGVLFNNMYCYLSKKKNRGKLGT